MAGEKILVVDDSPTILEVVKQILTQEGYEVETAATGIEGLNKAREAKPDLVILDVLLPGMQGYQVCRLLKFDQEYKNIPIIMYSSRDDENDISTGMKQGANAYLVKPVEPDTLIGAVKEQLAKAKEEV